MCNMSNDQAALIFKNISTYFIAGDAALAALHPAEIPREGCSVYSTFYMPTPLFLLSMQVRQVLKKNVLCPSPTVQTYPLHPLIFTNLS